MKIVTYNANGLRPRISQFGSLRKLLHSLVPTSCTFRRRSCRSKSLGLIWCRLRVTPTTKKGRTGYSGVATFCRVNSVFSSDEVSLPVSAEEGLYCWNSQAWEEMATPAGRQIVVQRSSTRGHVLITFLVLGRAYIRKKVKDVASLLAMLTSATY